MTDDAAPDKESPEQASPSEEQVETAAQSSSDAAAPPQDELQKLIAERDHYLEVARRSRADFENYQKRVARDLQIERKYALQPLLGDLLPVLDNLDRALEAAGGDYDGPARAMLDGVRMVRKQWSDALNRHGVVELNPDGQPFDPNEHEAVMQQPSDEVPPMTVLKTVQTGFRLYDRVVRPAQVIVAVAPSQPRSGEE
jgi:molecular chaperone GrpE